MRLTDRLRTKNDSFEEENEWLKDELTEIYDDKISRLNQQLFSSAVSTVYSEIFRQLVTLCHQHIFHKEERIYYDRNFWTIFK